TLTVGQAVYGAGIAPGTTIAAIPTPGTTGTITLSQKATAPGTGAGISAVTGNSYSGTTTVSQANFQVGVNNIGMTGTGALSVSSGATLSGSGVVNGVLGTTNHFIASGAALLPGDNFGANRGTLTFNGNLTISDASSMTLQVALATLSDSGILNALVLGKYDTIGGYRDSNITTWDATAITAGRHDLLTVNGTLTLNHSQITIADAGFLASAASGQIFNLGNWTALSGSSSFSVGDNYRNGGTGNGDLILPTLGGNLVYDVSQFATKGIFTIITLPSIIPVLINNYNLAGSGAWSSAANWSPNFAPNTTNGIATLATNITSNAIVPLNADTKVGVVIIGDQNNTHFFNITPGTGGRLIFDNGVYGTAILSKTQSNSTTTSVDVISAPVVVNSNLNINVGSGGSTARLDISGVISQSTGGLGVNIMGQGRVSLTGTAAN
ncbi:MAG: hypothetical protein WCJ28_06970, partial [Actinomycetota bacterium]